MLSFYSAVSFFLSLSLQFLLLSSVSSSSSFPSFPNLWAEIYRARITINIPEECVQCGQLVICSHSKKPALTITIKQSIDAQWLHLNVGSIHDSKKKSTKNKNTFHWCGTILWMRFYYKQKCVNALLYSCLYRCKNFFHHITAMIYLWLCVRFVANWWHST